LQISTTLTKQIELIARMFYNSKTDIVYRIYTTISFFWRGIAKWQHWCIRFYQCVPKNDGILKYLSCISLSHLPNTHAFLGSPAEIQMLSMVL